MFWCPLVILSCSCHSHCQFYIYNLRTNTFHCIECVLHYTFHVIQIQVLRLKNAASSSVASTLQLFGKLSQYSKMQSLIPIFQLAQSFHSFFPIKVTRPCLRLFHVLVVEASLDKRVRFLGHFNIFRFISKVVLSRFYVHLSLMLQFSYLFSLVMLYQRLIWITYDELFMVATRGQSRVMTIYCNKRTYHKTYFYKIGLDQESVSSNTLPIASHEKQVSDLLLEPDRICDEKFFFFNR